jgi:hypothetical protein
MNCHEILYFRQRDELLQFADAFDDQLFLECSTLNAKRKTTSNPSPDQKCNRSKYMARYVRESLKIEGIHVGLDELDGLVREINSKPEMLKQLSDACKEFVGLWNATDKAKSLPLEQISLQV